MEIDAATQPMLCWTVVLVSHCEELELSLEYNISTMTYGHKPQKYGLVDVISNNPPRLNSG